MVDDNVGQSSAEEEVPVVSLIHGRLKRSTAGRHMSALLNAEADDDLALLFEEVEDDNEFSVDAAEEGGEEDDMGLDSSSDDEDQGPNARSDDYEGETQLQKEEKAEKKKRRAQQDLRFKIVGKKVKIDPTAVSAVPAPRPKKKSERISWIPTPEEGPTRSSSRRQTMQNKELTHARLKDSEEKRIRLIATMEEAAKRKAQLKPKEMTQAERLAEAERVERHNSKSLNRWEEMEKRKAEERKAKIEALQNRRLEGPVMSYWSGIATWVDGRLTRLGKVDVTPKPEKEENARKKGKKHDKERKPTQEQKLADNSTSTSVITQHVPPTTFEGTTEQIVPDEVDISKEKQDSTQTEKTGTVTVQESDAKPESITNTAPDISTASAPPLAQDDTRDGEKAGEAEPQRDGTAPPEKIPESKPIDKVSNVALKTHIDTNSEESPKDPASGAQDVQVSDFASAPKPEEQGQGQVNQTPTTSEGNVLTTSKEPVAESVTAQPASETATAPQVFPTSSSSSPPSPPPAAGPTRNAPSMPAPPNPQWEAPATTMQGQRTPEVQLGQLSEDTPQSEVPQHASVIEHTGRSLTVLENFDDRTAQSREFSIYFNSRKPPRLTKISSSLCVITSLPSRYRDPETSLPFANAYGYNEIRNTVAQKYSWSSMLGCYVGPAGVAARGVPERFLDPQAKPPERVCEEKYSNGDGGPIDGARDKVGETNTPHDAPDVSNPATAAEAGAGDPMEIDKL
ncbi:YL1 nuclear protein-domain-containing protein [Aspergillus coremiiformis]|uniref:YL1 nuclear protein-domain-containing protein n=1 Tax=Aspergillus coremiiformis TaxID=138285 RepID=A0A5N6YT48_9EURO|nr:YL1 nuclear protein-domain-containing protein [Aspergillus coremiiformis]